MVAFTMCRGGSKHLQVNSCVTLLTEGDISQQDGLLWPLFVAAERQLGTASQLIKAY